MVVQAITGKVRRLASIKSLPKKPRTDAQKETAKQYESDKRSRSYQKSWEGQYEWLLYNPSLNKMYCRVCRSVYGPLALKSKSKGLSSDKFTKYADGPLVVGSSNFRKHALDVHKDSTGHKDAMLREF